MKIIAIYDPPKPGLPYLVASFSDDGAEILQARDKSTARELVIGLGKLGTRVKSGSKARRSVAEAS